MRTARFRPGFSLVELAVTVSIISIILVSLGSVILVAAKALPSAPGPTERTLSATAAADLLASEVRFATNVTIALPDDLEFTVPDRNNDGEEETIRYAWDGPGAPLTRSYNGGPPAAVSPPIDAFSLDYRRDAHTRTVNTTGTVSSGEVLLSSFSGWAGLLATSNNLTLSPTSWGAQAFVIDHVSFPADTTKISITRVSLKLRKPAGGTIGCTVAIHPRAVPGNSVPATSPLGTPVTLGAAQLPASFDWVDVVFDDVSFTDRSLTDFCIVVKGIATNSATLQYYSAILAPLDSGVFRWTTSGGGTWQPSGSLNTNDAPFTVYGVYERTINTTATNTTYTLGSLGIMLRATSDDATRIDTAVQTLNDPPIPAP